jgi:hypothetical protein
MIRRGCLTSRRQISRSRQGTGGQPPVSGRPVTVDWVACVKEALRFISHNHPVIQCYIFWVTECLSTNYEYKIRNHVRKKLQKCIGKCYYYWMKMDPKITVGIKISQPLKAKTSRWRIAEVQLHTCCISILGEGKRSALRTGRFAPCTHSTGDCVGQRAHLQVMVKIKLSAMAENRCVVVRVVSSHCIHSGIPNRNLVGITVMLPSFRKSLKFPQNVWMNSLRNPMTISLQVFCLSLRVLLKSWSSGLLQRVDL